MKRPVTLTSAIRKMMKLESGGYYHREEDPDGQDRLYAVDNRCPCRSTSDASFALLMQSCTRRCSSHDAVIRVYDAAGDVIQKHEHKGDFKVW